jgi:hypothetical protein
MRLVIRLVSGASVAFALYGCAIPALPRARSTEAPVFTHRFELQATMLGGSKHVQVDATSEAECKSAHRATWRALRDIDAELSACAPIR